MSKVLFYQTCECQKYYFTKHVNVKSIILLNTCQKYHFTKHMSKVSFYKTHVKSIILLNTCQKYQLSEKEKTYF